MKNESKIAVTSRSFSKNKVLRSILESKYKNVQFNDQGKSLNGHDLISFLKDTEKAIVGLEKFDANILDKLPNLKVISKYGVGLNNLDLKELKKRNIRLAFSPGVNKRPVAELTMLHIFMSLRKVQNSLKNIKDGIWSQEKGNQLSNKTLGIIGFGNIGRLVYDFLKPYECNVLIYDIEKIKDKSVLQCSIEDIFKSADIVTIHLPLLESTQNIVDKRLFNLCKKDLKLINTSRGGIVNEKDLFSFLKINKEAFAALDVFEVEPAFDSPLLNLENFYATSHLGSMTEEGIISMGEAAINGLE